MYKILVVGDFASKIHEEAISDAFINKGHRVEKFAFSKYFTSNILIKKLYFFQIRHQFGPFLYLINRFLKLKIESDSFDFIFFYRPVFVNENIFEIANKLSKVFIYNNDDPFGTNYSKVFWKKYFIGIKYAHRIFYYREKNKIDFEKIGFNNTTLLRSYYIKNLNFPLVDKKSIYTSDVSFIGHFENDGRDLILKYLLDNGVNLKIFGPEWRKSDKYAYLCDKIGEIFSLSSDYNLAINSTKIALVFFSKLNNDSYTRRCFEIPATRTFMLCEYSDEMSRLFIENREVVFFRNKYELLEKIVFYLNNPDLRNEIAKNGYEKVQSYKHEVNDRIEIILSEFESIKL
jgi:hypothetical protein